VLADAANSPCPTAAATAAAATAATAATAAATTSATAAASTAASAASATAAAPAAAAASGQLLAQPGRAGRFLVENVKRPQADVRDLFFTQGNLGRCDGIARRRVRRRNGSCGGCATGEERKADPTHHRYGLLTTPRVRSYLLVCHCRNSALERDEWTTPAVFIVRLHSCVARPRWPRRLIGALRKSCTGLLVPDEREI
jgi:hypothetical protein